MCPTWVRIVVSATYSSSEISALDRPRATSFSTSDSRSVRTWKCSDLMVDGLWVNSEIRRRVICGGEQGIALRNDANGGDELVGGVVLEHEAACAGAKRFVYVLVEVEGGKYEDARFAVRSCDDVAGRR